MLKIAEVDESILRKLKIGGDQLLTNRSLRRGGVGTGQLRNNREEQECISIEAEEARWRRSLSANQSFSKHKREELVVREKERKEAR